MSVLVYPEPVDGSLEGFEKWRLQHDPKSVLDARMLHQQSTDFVTSSVLHTDLEDVRRKPVQQAVGSCQELVKVFKSLASYRKGMVSRGPADELRKGVRCLVAMEQQGMPVGRHEDLVDVEVVRVCYHVLHLHRASPSSPASPPSFPSPAAFDSGL